MNEQPPFDEFLERLESALRGRVAADWESYRNELTSHVAGFVSRSREDLARWTGLLSAGALTRQDFEWLAKGRSDLAEMRVLERAGLTAIQIDRLRAAVTETVVGTAFRTFL